tara:strand:- start:77 stop:364 length:288 start_codon:yes stop_codon:yes gene_type:complete
MLRNCYAYFRLIRIDLLFSPPMIPLVDLLKRAIFFKNQVLLIVRIGRGHLYHLDKDHENLHIPIYCIVFQFCLFGQMPLNKEMEEGLEENVSCGF